MMSEKPAANEFIMHGAREAMSRGMPHIDAQIKSIERAVYENPALAFDLAKTLVESTCRTILIERGVAFDKDDELPKLFKSTTERLPILPVVSSGESNARKSLAQTLNGLSTALLGVAELRNAYGFASHGSEGRRPVMESAQALLAAQAADTIVGFLHRVHTQDRAILPNVRLEFTDNEEFNVTVDESNEPVRIFTLQYRPSEVLFRIDQDAYRDALVDYQLHNKEDLNPAEEAKTDEVQE